MYPAHYFSLFPAFPRDDRVFVAMSFDPEFEKRWTDVMEPAIKLLAEESPFGEYTNLHAHRVDRTKSGNSILIEILQEISSCQLIVADVTTLRRDGSVALRPANVLYEVGLAHAVRQPEEVVLFRSDSDPLPFDIANVRVHSYAPDTDPGTARRIVANTIIDALESVESAKQVAVEKAADSLDFEAYDFLASACDEKGIGQPTDEQALKKTGWLRALVRSAAAQRLLEIGAVTTTYKYVGRPIPKEVEESEMSALFSYRATKFGVRVYLCASERILGKRNRASPPDTIRS
jgi:hypothetical protein